MKRKMWFLLLGLLTLVLVLAACGGGPAGGPEAAGTGETEASDGGGDTAVSEAPAEGDGELQLADELSVYNWADYIDQDMIAAYEEEFGVDIIYDEYASNEDLLAKLQAGATGYDVIFPSDYMVAIMIDLGLLRKIDTNELSNFGNLASEFLDAPFDPGNQYCIPYYWGTTGIAYRAGYPFFEENPPDSWAYLFEPELLENYADDGINVLNDPRELTAAALMYLGYDPNTSNEDELNAARDLMLNAKPYWKTFNSSDYDTALLIPDEVVLSHAWSGGAARAYWETYDEEAEDGNWYYAIPKEGAVKWLDNICITADTEKYETAMHFMNYLLEPEVAGTITNYVYYSSPNTAADAFIDEELLNDPSIYPPPEIREKLAWLTEVDEATLLLYDQLWTAVKSQ
ncbi:MAG TPA: spermidine/putrescine ABC transporter substrate-binding protein [Anaerolineae bacterium]|nr:spermidine/putrescine ABC transporter substrate-binding protein [Anaerolineae bacterium]